MAIKTNIEIDVKSAQADRKLDRLDRKTNKLSKSTAGLTTKLSALRGSFLAVAAVGLAAVLANAAQEAVAFGDSIAKTADKLGLSTTALQELRFAAEQTGLTTQQLDIGVQRFTRRLGEAAEGSGVLASVLDDLDIELRDAQGLLRNTEDVLNDYADAIQGAENDQKRLLLAFKAFDTEGVAFVNTLRNGSAGLADLRQQAVDLGLIMDEHLIRKAEVATDRWNILTTQIGVKFKSALLSALGVIFDLRTPEEKLEEMRDRLQDINSEIQILAREMASPGLSQFGSDERILEKMKGLTAEAASLRREIESVNKAADKQGLKTMGEEAIHGAGHVKRMAEALAQLEKEQQEYIDATRVQFTTLADSVGLEMQPAWAEFSKQGTSALDEVAAAARGWGDEFTNTLADMVQTGKLDFRSLIDSMITDILRIAIYRNITAPLFGSIGLPIGGAAQAHTGGIVGSMPETRQVSPMVFAGAKRYHSGGLVGNEVPIIAQRGEEVLTRSDPRHAMNGGGGTVVNVNNHSTAQVKPVTSEGPNGEKIINVMIEDAVSNMVQSGRFDRLMTPYNIQRRGVR